MMLQNCLKTLAVCSLLTGATTAQAQVLTFADCGAVEEQMTTVLDAEFGIEVTQSASSVATSGLNGCRVSDLEIYVEALGVSYRAAQLEYSGRGLTEWVRGDVVLPATLDIRIDGLAVDPDRPIPDDLSWLRDVRAESIALSATWREATQRLQILPLRIDLGDRNIVTVTLDGRAVGWQAHNTPTPDFGITELALDVEFNGLFEQAIAPPIVQNGNDLSPDSMAVLAAMADGLLVYAPPRLVSAEARFAMVDFLRSLPTPRGNLGLGLTNDAPISLERIAIDLRTGVPFATAVPDTLTIDASWDSLN
ncbi:hypothetical protein KUL25_20955 [Rhodobacteraceae bacterium N5(2021)]|uniref:DUF2125 domain-containing protein n=1 Tax=Gymnodinialimonas phycosphaerae TaxID=2841589 RepID=A0A975TUN5_9RHOB|nr:hypothetical protein [Gymnodinialimonas phycosphaerae]MBY4895240.1 hypothetical protein [Gymnodinialimonas phycosphaerae]